MFIAWDWIRFNFDHRFKVNLELFGFKVFMLHFLVLANIREVPVNHWDMKDSFFLLWADQKLVILLKIYESHGVSALSMR